MAKPKDRDEQKALKLDERFKETLERFRPYILSLSVADDSQLCRAWLERLNRAVSQRSLRNRYLLELCRHLKSGSLGGIFSKLPQNGPLEPLPRICNYTMKEMPSSSELTDSSGAIPYEEPRRWRNPRRVKTAAVHCSSDSTSSLNEYLIAGSPASQKCDKSRTRRNQCPSYRQSFESLVAFVKKLEIENERLTHDLSYARENCACKESTEELRLTVDRLTKEITVLRSKLVEVQNLKDLLEKNYREGVQQYKTATTEEINEQNVRLHEAHSKNAELEQRVAMMNRQLDEVLQKNEEEVVAMQDDHREKMEHAQRNFEVLLNEKVRELQLKDETLSRKDSEMYERDKKSREEIALLNNKIQELEEKLEAKNEDEDKLQLFLKEQCSTLREEFAKLRTDMEIAAHMQNEKLLEKTWTLRKTIFKLEKSKEKMNFDCERRISEILKRKDLEIKCLHIQLQEQRTELASTLDSEKQCELDSIVSRLEERYKALLASADASAGNQRQHLLRKITHLENQIMILKNLVGDTEYL